MERVAAVEDLPRDCQRFRRRASSGTSTIDRSARTGCRSRCSGPTLKIGCRVESSGGGDHDVAAVWLPARDRHVHGLNPDSSKSVHTSVVDVRAAYPRSTCRRIERAAVGVLVSMPDPGARHRAGPRGRDRDARPSCRSRSSAWTSNSVKTAGDGAPSAGAGTQRARGPRATDRDAHGAR